MERPCPICGGPGHDSARYPLAVCGACAARATDAAGRRVEFANEDWTGGIVGYYPDTDEDYALTECFIDGIRCSAEEARFGGIVISRDAAS